MNQGLVYFFFSFFLSFSHYTTISWYDKIEHYIQDHSKCQRQLALCPAMGPSWSFGPSMLGAEKEYPSSSLEWGGDTIWQQNKECGFPPCTPAPSNAKLPHVVTDLGRMY